MSTEVNAKQSTQSKRNQPDHPDQPEQLDQPDQPEPSAKRAKCTKRQRYGVLAKVDGEKVTLNMRKVDNAIMWVNVDHVFRAVEFGNTYKLNQFLNAMSYGTTLKDYAVVLKRELEDAYDGIATFEVYKL